MDMESICDAASLIRRKIGQGDRALVAIDSVEISNKGAPKANFTAAPLLKQEEDAKRLARQFSAEGTQVKDALARDPKDDTGCRATAPTFFAKIENPAKKQKVPPHTPTA